MEREEWVQHFPSMEPILSYVSVKIPLTAHEKRAGIFFPLSFLQNSAAELILHRLSKTTQSESQTHDIWWELSPEGVGCRGGSPLGGKGARRARGLPGEKEKGLCWKVRKPWWLVISSWGLLVCPHASCYLQPQPALLSPRWDTLLTPWACVLFKKGHLETVVERTLLCLSFPPFIPNGPSHFPLPSQALSPVIWCPVFFELCFGFIIFSMEVSQGKAAHQRCDPV